MKHSYYVGMGFSKGYVDDLILDGSKKPQENSFQLDDNKLGHQGLNEYVLKLSETRYVICGVESTGGYERNWVMA